MPVYEEEFFFFFFLAFAVYTIKAAREMKEECLIRFACQCMTAFAVTAELLKC